MSKKLRRRCVSCRKVMDVLASPRDYEWSFWDHRSTSTNMAVWQIDPFAEEIRGDRTKMWLCLDCAYERYMDV